MPSALFTPLAGRIFMSFAGYLIQSAFQKSPGPQFAKSTVRATVLDGRYLYGERRTGGQLIFAKVKDDTLHMAFCLSEGPLAPITEVYIDGDPLSRIAEDDLEPGEEQPTGGLNVIEQGPPRKLGPNRANKFSEHIEIWEYFAADGTQGAELRTAFPDDWTADHVDPGVSWVYVTLRQNEGKRKLFSKIPTLSFRTGGIMATWPGQDTPAPIVTAAQAWWHFLTVVREIPPDAIPQADVLAAIALSGALVPTEPPLPEGYEAYEDESIRYRLDAEINHGMTVAEVQQLLNFAWNGHILDIGGRIHFRPGAADPVSRTIGVQDIMARQEVSFDLPLVDRYNAIHMQLEQSKQKEWDEQDMPILEDRSLQAIMQQRRVLELGSYRGTTWPIVALRLMVAEQEAIREGATYRYTLTRGEGFENCLLLPGDRVWLDDPENGLDPDLEGAVPFRLLRVRVNGDWTVEIEAREDPDGLYDDMAQLPPLLPRALQPGVSDDPPPMPQNVTVTTNSHYRSDGGDEVAVIGLSWTDLGFRTIFQVTDPGFVERTQEVSYGNSVQLRSDRSGPHVIAMWHENAWGVRGPEYEPMPGVRFIVTTSVAGKPPTPVITDVRWRGSLVVFSLRIATPINDLQGVDVRFTQIELDSAGEPPRLSLSDPSADPPITGNWDNPMIVTRVADVAIAGGLAGRTLQVSAGPLLEQGKFRFGLRLVNRAGLLSDIAQTQTSERITITDPRHFTESFGGGRVWLGTRQQAAQVPFPNALTLGLDGLPNGVFGIRHVLAADPRVPNAVSGNTWDGRLGWPVGAAVAPDGTCRWLSATHNVAGLFGQVAVTGIVALPRILLADTSGDIVADNQNTVMYAFYGATASALGRVNVGNAYEIATGATSRPAGVNVRRIVNLFSTGNLGGEAEFFRILIAFNQRHVGLAVEQLSIDYEVVI